MKPNDADPRPGADILLILEQSRDEELIGVEETEQLDFKAQYALSEDRAKWELAKDVAALANSGGGLIVIGVETRADIETDSDIADRIRPVPAAMMRPKQFRDAIASGCYPPPRGVDVVAYPRPDAAALGAILVPPQPEDQLPCLSVRMLEGDMKRGVGVGVPYRSGPHTAWEAPGIIHRDLSEARRTRRRPTPGSASRPEPASTQLVPAQVAQLTDAEATRFEHFLGMPDYPLLLLAAVPQEPQPVPIEGFYERSRILGSVANPPTIRQAGFALAWSREPENVDGALLNGIADRTLLRVEPNGITLAGAVGAPQFLTRSGGSREASNPEARSINPTVLVEWSYLFCLFVSERMAPSIDGAWTLAARLRGARERPWPLRLLGGIDRDVWRDGSPPGMDDWHMELPASLDPGRDAFALLRGIYSLFGLGQEQIPYTTESAVDPSQIQAIG